MRYVALIHKEPGSSYGISFPDLPGCISAGSTAHEAITNAAEALAFHVAGMRADGEPVPAPRSLEEILADPALAPDREGANFAHVPLIEDRGSPKRLNVSLDPGLLEAIDEAVHARGTTRSAFLASAPRRELLG